MTTAERTARIEYLPLDAVLAAFNRANPKAHDLDEIAASIRRFGMATPIVYDETSQTIIEGHGRASVLRQMRERGESPPLGVPHTATGDWLVPVVRGIDFAPGEAQRFLVAANRLVELGGWDDAALVTLLQEFAQSVDGLAGTGFTDVDLAALLDGIEIEPESAELDAVGPVADIAMRVSVGDVFTLGRHRLICGDSTDPAVISRLLDAERPTLVFADPPYGVAYEGKTAQRLRIQNDALGPEETRALIEAVCVAVRPYLPAGTPYYCCCPAGDMEPVLREAIETLGPVRQAIAWVKQSPVLGRQDYHWRHESILYGWVPGAKHRWFGGRSEDSVWEIPRPSRSEMHPTMKPVELVRRALRNSTKPGDRVLDPFAGSGTTVIACETSRREARVVEIDPRYAQVTIERWEHLTGETAIKEDWR